MLRISSQTLQTLNGAFKSSENRQRPKSSQSTESGRQSPNSVADFSVEDQHFRSQVQVKTVGFLDSYQQSIGLLSTQHSDGSISQTSYKDLVENLNVFTVQQMVLALGKLAIETVDQSHRNQDAMIVLKATEGHPLEKKDFKKPALDRLTDFSKKIGSIKKDTLIKQLNKSFQNTDGSNHDEEIKKALRPLFSAVERVGVEPTIKTVIQVIESAEKFATFSEKLHSRDSDRLMTGKLTSNAFGKREEAYHNAMNNAQPGILIDRLVSDLKSVAP